MAHIGNAKTTAWAAAVMGFKPINFGIVDPPKRAKLSSADS
jgi:hypothetical protein